MALASTGWHAGLTTRQVRADLPPLPPPSRSRSICHRFQRRDHLLRLLPCEVSFQTSCGELFRTVLNTPCRPRGEVVGRPDVARLGRIVQPMGCQLFS
jgi:hypothetical protein